MSGWGWKIPSMPAGGKQAASSADQVRMVVNIAKELSLEPATPDEVRDILDLKGLDQWGFKVRNVVLYRCPDWADENRIVESEEVRPGVVLDFDENDRVVGVEFLGISARATTEELSNMQFQTA